MRHRIFILLFAFLALPLSAQAQKVATDSVRIEKKAEVTVYITKSGKKYHRGGCRYLSKSSIALNLSEAKKYHQPCRHCKPPE